MVLREAKLFLPVSDWLKSQGYTVFGECWGHDVVAYRDDLILTVELKMSLSRKVCQQLVRAARFSNYVYAGVPTNPRKSSLELCDLYGVGVLRIGDEVDVVRDCPIPQRFFQADWHTQALTALKGWTPLDNQVGGVPVLKGEGAAQKCAQRVREYAIANPKAGWRDVFRDVPNHYAHHRSMRGAMPPLDYLRNN